MARKSGKGSTPKSEKNPGKARFAGDGYEPVTHEEDAGARVKVEPAATVEQLLGTISDRLAALVAAVQALRDPVIVRTTGAQTVAHPVPVERNADLDRALTKEDPKPRAKEEPAPVKEEPKPEATKETAVQAAIAAVKRSSPQDVKGALHKAFGVDKVSLVPPSPDNYAKVIEICNAIGGAA